MKKIIYFLLIALLIISCSDSNDGAFNDEEPQSDGGVIDKGDDNDDNVDYTNWLIPVNEIFDGGPGKDGIPSIDSPVFLDAENQDFIEDDDLVIGILVDGLARAYPHAIMDWHEIVNDNLKSAEITINYCPLTGTAFVWDSMSGGSSSSFGVSGLLYKANLILYDRNTNSNWSQLGLQCVNGELIGNRPILTNVVETNWKTWKNMYPDSKILSTDTGFDRPYHEYPYGPYIDRDDFFIFNVTPLNDELPFKERVHAIMDNNKSKVYRFENFDEGFVIKDSFFGKNYLIIGNQNIIESYLLPPSLLEVDFEYEISSSGGFFKDSDGNQWSVFGEAVSGPSKGDKLTPSVSVMGYWFAIAAFFPDPIIYQD